MKQTNAVPESRAAGSLELFEYPAGADTTEEPDWSAFSEIRDDTHAAGTANERVTQENTESIDPAVFGQQLAEEKRRAFEEGRQRGVQEGRQAEREAQAAALSNAEAKHVRQAVQLMESFAVERDRYLEAVEPEVVKLALAVAARILRREAQMDPLLLTGAVRVALGQLAKSTEVRLKVPAADLDLWTEAIALLPNLALKPSVIADQGMRLGDCAIEASMGTVDLGVRSQLAEIERGFFDRAGGQRPETKTNGNDAAGAGGEKQA